MWLDRNILPNMHVLIHYPRIALNTRIIVPHHFPCMETVCCFWWSCVCYLFQPNTSRDPETVQVNESIISLLLKLHSQLTGTQNSYRPDHPSNNSFTDRSSDSRIGDGPFFVAKLLWRISALDTLCRYLHTDFILWLFLVIWDLLNDQ